MITDEAGRVVGYGMTGFAPDTSDLPHRKGWKRSGWHGHFVKIGPALVTAYALIDGERTVCRLGDVAIP